MTQRPATPFGLILLLWAAGLGAAAQYGKVSVIYFLLPDHYPQAGAALAFIVSIVGFTGIVLGVLAGHLVARFGYRRSLLWALWFGAALSLLEALLPPLPVMLALRLAEGLSHLAIVVAAPTLIAQLSAPRHRGLTLSLWSTFFGVSYTALVWLGLPMVARLGLPSLFVAHGVWMAGAALLVQIRLPALNTARPSQALSLSDLPALHMQTYRSPFVAAPGFGWLFYTFCYLALLTLIPPFIDPSYRAALVGAIPLVSIVTSMTVGVYLLGRYPAVRVVLAGFALVALALGWLLVAPGGIAPSLALAVAFGLVQGASFACVPQLNNSAADQARANGAMAQMGNIGNTVGTPVLAAAVAGIGYGGMIGTALIVTVLGLLTHAGLDHLRRRTEQGQRI
ncbi:MFS transporter [Aliishimia ponticola]|uniref:MFS transporter n=1 Tax=Aliishimia ponticola TaxID=2499833 RepID=A0A4S4NQ68_9RHOB|nr:MFS transporter [Aliishimia ponticola]THH38340.1 MFS transporter [Aliishimia ponticola]